MATEQVLATVLGQEIKGRRPVAASATGTSIIEGNWTAIATVLTALAARTNRGITSGTAVPTTGTLPDAVIGDWYVRTSTGDWYELEADGWTLLMATKGTGISSAAYADGTLTLTLTDSTTTTVAVPSVTASSAEGGGAILTTNTGGVTTTVTIDAPEDGADGTVVTVGSGDAGRPATPSAGDVYIDTSTWTLYGYASDAWTSRGTWQPGYTMADALTGDDYVDHSVEDPPGTDNAIVLADNTQYRLTSSGLTGIELKAATGLQIATLRAVSTTVPYEWYVPLTWVCIGDSCSNGVHVPAASTRYQYTIVVSGDTVQPYTVYCTQIPYIVE